MRSSSGPEIRVAVALDLRGRAAALALRVAVVAAGTGVHRRHEHEAAGERRRSRRRGRWSPTPSSSGWRSTSSTLRWNSGSSSRNSTPWCARLTSPGIGCVPPPSSPASEIVWCGARNGRVATSGWCEAQRARDAVDLGRLQRLLQRHRREDRGNPLGQHGLARARRADHQQVVPAGHGHLERALGVLLALDVGEVLLVAAEVGEDGRRDRREAVRAAARPRRKSAALRRVSHRVHVEAVHHGGLLRVVRGHEQLPAVPGPRAAARWAARPARAAPRRSAPARPARTRRRAAPAGSRPSRPACRARWAGRSWDPPSCMSAGARLIVVRPRGGR